MKRPDIVATITGNNTEEYGLKYSVPKLLQNVLADIGADNLVVVTIKKFHKPNTKRQRHYLWGVVYPMISRYIKDCVGQDFSPKLLHERAKKQYLGYEICEIPGMEDLVKPRSSTDLDSEEFFKELVEHLCREWGTKGLFIPIPDPQKRK